jgi:mannose-6-phosphate isomerase-like protein (cupin superfamily)
VVAVGPGISLSIPTGAAFQFRCEGTDALVAVAATMPPWPGENEAYGVAGPWTPTV